ncbi:MAG TPA: OB-fold domain-containing protein [Nocardioides sp.]|nr:OB-fold domain-containing protein [Nocardioides sp.]
MPRTLQAPVTVAFDYTRSTGPVLGRFFTGLRDGVVMGGRTSSGQVLVPPPEFDPDTHEQVIDFVELSPTGTVTSWAWCPEPVAGQPLDRPFAWVQVRLDGADGTLLHALDVSSPDDVETGMRVQVRWADERVGAITDIQCFEAESDAAGGLEMVPEEVAQQPSRRRDAGAPSSTTAESESVTGIITPVELDYLYAASPEESAFYRGLEEGRIIGQRCPVCRKVYVPPRSACPVDGVATTDEVELSDRGTVTTFCIVNVPFLGQRITPPYVSAYVLLDGADIAFLHLILDIPAEEVRMGMRVEAVWKPREEWGTTIENISHFRPTGEPDADFESYKVHL